MILTDLQIEILRAGATGFDSSDFAQWGASNEERRATLAHVCYLLELGLLKGNNWMLTPKGVAALRRAGAK